MFQLYFLCLKKTRTQTSRVVLKYSQLNTFFSKQCSFSTQPQCCLTFLWIELQMLLWCCLIHITIIIIVRHILYLSISVSMSRAKSIYVLSFWHIFHFQPHFHCHQSYNVIKTDALVFCMFLEHLLFFLDDNMDEDGKWFSNNKRLTSGCYLAFAYFFSNFSLVLLMKVLLIEKSVYPCFSTAFKIGLRIFTGFWINLCSVTGIQTYLPRGISKENFSQRFFKISRKAFLNRVFFKEVIGIKQDSFDVF